MVDALTALQVADTATLSNNEIVRQIDDKGPRAARWRSKTPWLFRKVPIKEQVGDKSEFRRVFVPVILSGVIDRVLRQEKMAPDVFGSTAIS